MSVGSAKLSAMIAASVKARARKRRMNALYRREQRDGRASAVIMKNSTGPISPPIKVLNPEIRRMIDLAVERKKFLGTCSPGS